MSLTAAQIITLRAPKFATEERLADLISLAENGLSSSVFGTRYEEALALQVCHWLTKEERRGVGGPVVSEQEGGLARSYGAYLSGDKGDLLSTAWGIELQDLIKSVVVMPFNRMTGI